jgi:anti-anti-sigma factor
MATSDTAKILELTVEADEGQLSRVRDFVVNVCETASFSPRETSNTKLAIDEACTNIIKHAYTEKSGDIKVRAEISSGQVMFRIYDTGEHFDFASIKDPDLDQYVESGKKGGLGVFLINRLMDGVEYRANPDGNELVLAKKSRASVSKVLPSTVSWRNSLRFKFTLRASMGLLFLVAAIFAFIFVRQTGSINNQRNVQWLEKKRLATNLAARSKDLLMRPEAYSLEQTNLSAYLAKLVDNDESVGYVRVLDREGKILSSGNVEEMFTEYEPPVGEVLLSEESGISWIRVFTSRGTLRNISVPVSMEANETGNSVHLGEVHVGIYEAAVDDTIHDPRLSTASLILVIYLVGVLLIMGLVSVFVKPIQVLTDGVRAIGEGSFDGKISEEGPAEIGAIAGVFNEITHKFKKAQDSILEQEKLQKEMEVAKQIQHSLLPKKMPDVSGYDIAPYYQSAREVGGDYYDFVQVDDDTVGIVVADVSGKGVPGSLVMTMIRTALRMEARGNKNASDVMAKMNDFVTDDMRKGMFVTMFYVILDSKNRIVSYASAGHNPMVLYRRETNETYFLNPKGFPVGISLPDEALFRKSISLEKIKLKKDDMLLIYTDGVTEAMNERRDQYGEERLLSLIKENGQVHPKEFIARLEADIKTFTGGHPQNDDITVVAIKEKMTADDVLSGLRKKLIDMVDIDGMSVKEACSKMKVSPATYYRYKKRLELLGERGLKNKVLREDLELKRVSLEARKKILEIVKEHPEYGAKRIMTLLNEDGHAGRKLTEKMVYDELKRLNLNTKELRIEYLKRSRLIDVEELAEESAEEQVERVVEKADSELVDEFLEEVSATTIEPDSQEQPETAPFAEFGDIEEDKDFETAGDLGLSIKRLEGDITLLRIEGHLDSVSSSALEGKLKNIISGGEYNIVVDLSSVSYISSGGWGIFSGEVKRLRESGGDVVLVGMSSEVYDVYDLLGFADILHAFATVDDACQHFQLSPEERIKRVQDYVPEPTSDDMPGLTSQVDELEEEIPGESYVPEWESLRIEATTVGDTGDIAVLSMNGIIDTVSAENLRMALDRVITSGLNKIVVDMSLVEYVSSGGWGAFTERLREVRRAGGDVKLFGMDPDVYYVFTMLGFNIVLSSFDVLVDAIEDFGRETDEMALHPELPSDDIFDSDDKPMDHVEKSPGGTSVDELGEIDVDGEVAEDVIPDDSSSQDLVRWEEASGGVVISHLRGFIDATAVAALTKSIETRVSTQPSILLFDLRAVEYISSTGWGLFSKYHGMCSAWGGRVVLCSLSDDLYEIYRYLEFHAMIPAYPSKEEALASIGDAGSDTVQPFESTTSTPEADPLAGIDTPDLEDGSLEDILPVDEILDAPTELEETPPVEDETQVEPVEESVADIEYKAAEDEQEPELEQEPEQKLEHAPQQPEELPMDMEEEEAVPTEDTAVPETEPVEPEEQDETQVEPVEEPVEESVTEPPPIEEVSVDESPGEELSQEEAPEQEVPEEEVPLDEPPPRKSYRFVDESRPLDVDSAVSDKNISEDEDLRRLGWAKYGEQLRRNKKKGKDDK